VTGLLEHPAAIGAPPAEVLALRPAGPDDREAVRAFLAGLSPETAYRRFFTGIGSPSPMLVRRLVEVDHDRREAVLALLGPQVVGLADCTRLAEGRTVELGVVVADAWQRLGIGPRLSRAVLDLAVARGASTLRVHALADNSRVVRLLRRQWPEHRPALDEGTLVWDLPLAAAPGGSPAGPGPRPGQPGDGEPVGLTTRTA
jgi:GNAT superfamily N-acetyltransferase